MGQSFTCYTTPSPKSRLMDKRDGRFFPPSLRSGFMGKSGNPFLLLQSRLMGNRVMWSSSYLKGLWSSSSPKSRLIRWSSLTFSKSRMILSFFSKNLVWWVRGLTDLHLIFQYLGWELQSLGWWIKKNQQILSCFSKVLVDEQEGQLILSSLSKYGFMWG